MKYKPLDTKRNIDDLTQEEILALLFSTEKKEDALTLSELTEEQKGMWVFQTMFPQSHCYNVCGAYYISNEVDAKILEDAVKNIIGRHKVLGVNITYLENDVYQSIQNQMTFVLTKIDCTDMENESINDRISKVSTLPFSLEKELLIRGYLFMTGKEENVILFCFHHIIFDLESAKIFWRELEQEYIKRTGGELIEQKEPENFLYQYVLEEKLYLNSKKAYEDKIYWEEYLKHYDTFNIITQEQDLMEGSNQYQDSFISLPSQIIDWFQTCTFSNHVTLSSVFTVLFQLTLCILNKSRKILIGMPVSLRKKQYKDAIGCYINMMPVIGIVDDELSIKEYMEQVHASILNGLEHSRYPYQLIMSELNKKRNSVGDLLKNCIYYQETFLKDNSPLLRKRMNEVHQSSEYPLVLEVKKEGQTVKGLLRYAQNIYDNVYVHEFKYILTSCIELILVNSEIILKDLFHSIQANTAIKGGSKAEDEISYLQNFILQVARHKDKTAVVYKDIRLTYLQLYKEIRKMEAFLKKRGVNRGDKIGVLLSRSQDCIITFLAIEILGCIYIPMDVNYPDERIRYMIMEANVEFLIVNTDCNERELTKQNKYIELHKHRSEIDTIISDEVAEHVDMVRNINSEDTAYIIFTSGSTGKPKGIMVSNKNLNNFLGSMSKIPGCKEEDYIFALTTVSFDISILELLLPLTVGAIVEILPDDIIRDGIKLLDKFIETNVTMMQATPTTWRMLLDAGWDHKKSIKILIGGEDFSETLKNELLNLCDECWNMYGPTETTIWSMIGRLSKQEEISLGVPIDNTFIKLLDQEKNFASEGEIYIGGAGVSKGYFNNEEETNKRFRVLTEDSKTREIFYQTGDIGRLLPNGKIKYIERKDFQVKINGFRIELEEIKSQLVTEKDIKEAVVLLHNEDDRKELTAYVIHKSNKAPDIDWTVKIKNHLYKTLPQYMIPEKIIPLRKFPLTENMKVDIKYLSFEPLKNIIAQYAAKPQITEEAQVFENTAVQGFLTDQISKLKGIDAETIDCKELIGNYGFDSLLFTRLCYGINKEYNIKINASIFYSYPTIKMVSEYLTREFNLDKQDDMSINNISKVVNENQSVENIQATTQDLTEETQGIAVIGLAGILPGCDNIASFWNKIMNGESMITEIPKERWDVESYYDPNNDTLQGSVSRWGGFINGVYDFDSSLFGISPKEIDSMDPQQRLMLRVVWTLIENAGYNYEDFSATDTGVFIGATSSDFSELLLNEGIITPHMLSGIVNAVIANRISYFFNLLGPSEVTDTACSSGLVSVCKAVESIQNGDCTMAIAGGVNVILSPTIQSALSKVRMLSKDGKCKTFDQHADGYVRGEGCAAVLLKSLKKAKEDKDHIYAVIKGHCINHGGRTNSLTSPNGLQQRELVIKAMERSEVNPYAVGYIEAHGTGTALGDPIEIKALQEAYQYLFQKFDQNATIPVACGIGSVKTNIGHLEAAAGVVGLIKTILVIYNKKIPASLNCSQINSYIELENSHFYLLDKAVDYKRLSIHDALYAGVSSFGFGGTNAHVVLAEHRDLDSVIDTNHDYYLFVLSAKSTVILKRYMIKWIEYLEQKIADKEKLDLYKLTYILQTGRKAFENRISIVISSVEELLQRLKTYSNEVDDHTFWGTVDKKRSMDYKNKLSIFAMTYEELKQHASAWVLGANVNWKEYYQDGKPEKMELPTYPFELKTFKKVFHKKNEEPMVSDRLHYINIIDYKESMKAGLVFRVLVGLNDIYIAQHQINGEKILPCAVYVEMILEVYKKINQWKQCEIRNLELRHPLSFLEKTQEELFLSCSIQNEMIQVIIYSIFNENQIIHCIATVGSIIELPEKTFGDYDRKTLSGTRISKEECYKLFLSEAGINYGAYFQCVKEAFIQGYRIDSHLIVLSEYADEFEQTLFHPAIFDGILQTAGLFYRGSNKLRVPFIINLICLYTPLVNREYIVLAEKKGDTINAFLTDEAGHLYAMVSGYQSREMADSNRNTASGIPRMYNFEWRRDELLNVNEPHIIKDTLIIYSEENFILGVNREDSNVYINLSKQYTEAAFIRSVGENLKNYRIKTILFFALDDLVENELNVDYIKNKQTNGMYAYINIIKSLAETKKSDTSIYVITNNLFGVYKEEEIIPTHGAIYGLNNAARQECKDNQFYHIDIDWYPGTTYDILHNSIASIMAGMYQNRIPELAIRKGACYRRWLIPSDEVCYSKKLKKRGTYIILGAGGIGFEIAEYLINNYEAKVILVARSDHRMKKNSKIKMQHFDEVGAEVTYIRGDIANAEGLHVLFDYVEQRFGRINGVFSCAMVLKDVTIKQSNRAIFEDVLYPKVDGSIALYQELKNKNIDFWAIFSSVCSYMPREGQGSYSSASSFQDIFAEFCRKHLTFDVRLMNWSYWGEVGQVADAKYVQKLNTSGLVGINTKDGLNIINRCINGKHVKTLIMNSEQALIDKFFLFEKDEVSQSSNKIKKEYPGQKKDYKVEESLENYNRILKGFQELEEYSNLLLLKYYRNNHLFLQAGESYPMQVLQERLGVIHKYHQLFHTMLYILSRRGWLTISEDDVVTTTVAIEEDEIADDLIGYEEKFLLDYFELKPYIKLLRRCMDGYGDVLCGKKTYVEIMFTNGSKDYVSELYYGNAVVNQYIYKMAEYIKEYVNTMSKKILENQKLHILEIGAGTGGTSGSVFKELLQYKGILNYWYTDISYSFLKYGKEKYGSHEFIIYKVLDIEKDITKQGFINGSFDVILCSDVLHATSNIDNSLQNVRKLLKQNGLFLLNEITSFQNFTTLTFGLTDGWWLSKDNYRMYGSALLNEKTWMNVLQYQGFTLIDRFKICNNDGKNFQTLFLSKLCDIETDV